jgi:hypothetical protein
MDGAGARGGQLRDGGAKMENGDLIAQLNASWRVVLVDRKTLRRAWLLQHMVDGAWCDKAVVRSSEMLRWLVQAHAGPVDADAAAILTELPARVDLRVRGSSTIKRAPGKRARAAEMRAAVAARAAEKRVRIAAGAGTRRAAAAAAAFLTWRAENATKGEADSRR